MLDAPLTVLGRVNELHPGWRRTVRVGAVSVLVHVEEDGVYAIENACPHYQVALDPGRRRGGFVECPWHHWLIDIRTGECMHNPRVKAPTYVVTIEDGAYVLRGQPVPAPTPAPAQAQTQTETQTGNSR